MKSISSKTLIRKSRNFRNDQAIQRLAQIDSLRDWANNEVPLASPEFYPEKPKKNMIWWVNFFKSSIYQLKP